MKTITVLPNDTACKALGFRKNDRNRFISAFDLPGDWYKINGNKCKKSDCITYEEWIITRNWSDKNL